MDWRDIGADEIRSEGSEMHWSRTVVADLSGAVVGMLNYADNLDPPDACDPVGLPFSLLRRTIGPGLYLRALAVHEDRRGLGIGRRLLDLARSAANANASPSIGVIVHSSKGRLIEHYRSRGFMEIASEPVRSHHAYPTNSPLVALRLPLDAR